MTKLLIQNQYDPMSAAKQVLSLFAAKHKFLKPVKVEDVQRYESEMLKYMERAHADIIKEIDEKKVLDDDLNNRITDALNTFSKQFQDMMEG